MSNTVEELLKPRYKVIVPWPGMEVEPFALGQIVTLQKHPSDEEEGFIHIPLKHIPGSYMREQFFLNYPHLFRKLEWWEERAPEDMPKYVKVIREDCAKDTGLYCKVYNWHTYDDKFPLVKGQFGAELEGYKPPYILNSRFNFEGQVYGRLNATHLLPATAEEYNNYKAEKDVQ